MSDKSSTPGYLTQDPFVEGEEYRPHALIYGPSGVGKTGLASTAPSPLIIDLEDGATVTVRAVGNRDARIVKCYDMRTIRQIYSHLKSGEHSYRSVVIDPLGDLQRLLMEEALEKYPQKRAFSRIATMQDWSLVSDDFRKLINAFRSLPLHTVLIAHSQSRDHDEDVVQPLLQGKQMLSYATRSMDLLGYMYLETVDDEPRRRLLTQGTANIAAKNRGSYLNRVVEDPNLTEIFAAMMGPSATEQPSPAPARSKRPKVDALPVEGMEE